MEQIYNYSLYVYVQEVVTLDSPEGFLVPPLPPPAPPSSSGQSVGASAGDDMLHINIQVT